jgi:RNA-directed DNA polymerase
LLLESGVVDDLVILCEHGKAEEALLKPRDHGQAEADGQRGEDTHLQGTKGEFDFLGYTFGRLYSAMTGQARKKSMRRMVEKIHAMTALKTVRGETTKLVGKLTRTLRRLGELLQCRHGQTPVSGARQLHFQTG